MFQLTLFHIKVVAIVTMIIDHIGVFFFPQVMLFRIIGRIAFPLFAWMIANGAYHTHNMRNYLLRLLGFAFLSQIPFLLPNQYLDPSFWYLNVLFTLFLGLVAIAIIKQTTNKAVWFLTITICASLANFLKTDYGAAGVLSIVAFYLSYHSMRYTILSQTVILFLLPMVTWYLSRAYHTSFSYYYISSYIEPYAILALILLFFYKGKQGPRATYLFYLIYPLQYLVFYFLLKLR